jgi:hypothetical protein
MKGIGDTILTLVVLGGILILSAIITNLFTRKMYNRCSDCGALNAKRRSNCRVCNEPLAGR